MNEVKVSRKDIIWSYLAQFFSIGAGFVTLPLILNRLSAEEVGFNYILLTVGSIASLFDLGFVVQFGRNITYVLSGAKELKENGVAQSSSSEVDFHLLKNVIDTAQFVYKRLSVAVLLILLTFGTAYVYMVTDGFSKVENSVLIWILYCISIYFNLYYKYLDSLLNGAALIQESRKATIYSKSVYILIAYTLLLSGNGLISVVVANLVAPFVSRFYSYKKFYTKEIKQVLNGLRSTNDEIIKVFRSIWATTKMLALNMIGSFASNQAGMFIAGFFLTLTEIGSYGLMLQLFNILSGLSISVNTTIQPEFCKNRVKGDYSKLLSDVSFSACVALVVKFSGSLAILFIAPYLLLVIRSNSLLPGLIVMSVYAIHSLLHDNMVCFCTFITSGNEVPFVKPSLITAVIIIFSMTVFMWLGMGIWGAVLGIMIPELCYNSWRWMIYVLKEFNISIASFYSRGFIEVHNRVTIPITNKLFHN